VAYRIGGPLRSASQEWGEQLSAPPHTKRIQFAVLCSQAQRMFTLLQFLFDGFSRFQAWFDKRFGWFFTNGMKKQRDPNAYPLKA
jgi:hypothetical protein